MKRFLTFLKVEGKLSLRCPDGIIFGIGMPVGVLLLIAVVAGSQSAGGADYSFLQSAFASLLTVGICATAFMGLPLTIADYRDKKILKHFFATPIRPFMILFWLWIPYGRESDSVHRCISACHAIHVQHRHDSGQLVQDGENRERRHNLRLFSHAVLIGCNHPLRAVSGHCAKGMQCPAADTWYQAVKGGFFKHVESGDMDICRPFDCFRSCRLYHFCCII